MKQTPPPPTPSKEDEMEATEAVPALPTQEEEHNQPDPQPESAPRKNRANTCPHHHRKVNQNPEECNPQTQCSKPE